MLSKHMGAQTAALIEAAPTVGALERSLSCVAAPMSVQVAPVLERTRAEVAAVGAFSSVNSHMTEQVSMASAGVAAARTVNPRLFASVVCHLVHCPSLGVWFN